MHLLHPLTDRKCCTFAGCPLISAALWRSTCACLGGLAFLPCPLPPSFSCPLSLPVPFPLPFPVPFPLPLPVPLLFLSPSISCPLAGEVYVCVRACTTCTAHSQTCPHTGVCPFHKRSYATPITHYRAQSQSIAFLHTHTEPIPYSITYAEPVRHQA